ncbi:hypothetical protein [Anaerotruncus colihominis]|nr:hypothetical protein [Anaerotruncus colihominis]UWN76690.1 hypothetical protein NQ528_03095 [Anaerotruncus colihominis]
MGDVLKALQAEVKELLEHE